MNQYYEHQYKILDESLEEKGLAKFGPMAAFTWNSDPKKDFPVEALCHNFCIDSLCNSDSTFDGAYLLDVLEHIEIDHEPAFFSNLCKCLKPSAKVVIGMPSIESQVYASEGSKAGHVNCKTKENLVSSLDPYFSSVTCFSMNDEVVHTGFNRLANYLLAVCVL